MKILPFRPFHAAVAETSGIRLPSDSTQVQLLVGSIPCQVVLKEHDGLLSRTVLVRVQPWQPEINQ